MAFLNDYNKWRVHNTTRICIPDAWYFLREYIFDDCILGMRNIKIYSILNYGYAPTRANSC